MTMNKSGETPLVKTTPSPTTDLTIAQSMQRIGRTGLRSYMGILHEQELVQLQNVLVRMRIFREMRLDTTIGILEQAITRVLLAADFATVPAGNTPADQYAADLLWDIMNDMTVEWYEHVEDALEHLWFGFAVTQIVGKFRPDGKIGLSDLMPMAQEMTFRWGRQDESGRVSGVEMLDPVTGKIYRIPSEKFLHFTDRGRKRNPEGEGMCLHVWKSWRYKTNLQELEAIGIERDIGGMPVFTTPAKPGTQEANDLIEQAKAMRMDENMALVISPDTTVEPYNSGGAKQYDIRKVIEDYSWDILAYAGAQWLKLGQDNGTQALVQGTTDMFGLYLRAIQARMLSVWHKQLIPTLAAFNPKMVTPNGLPKITWSDPGVPDVKAILEAYNTGITAGVITPTRADEEHIRGIMGLPDLPEGMGIGERNPFIASPEVLQAHINELDFKETPDQAAPPVNPEIASTPISDLEFSASFDPSEHPRGPAGESDGGKFVPKGSGSTGSKDKDSKDSGKSSSLPKGHSVEKAAYPSKLGNNRGGNYSLKNDKGEVVGHSSMVIHHKDTVYPLSGKVPAGTAVIDIIEIDEKKKGKGLGKGLLDHMEQDAISAGAKEVWATHVMRDGDWFWEKEGYKAKPGTDGGIMIKKLGSK